MPDGAPKTAPLRLQTPALPEEAMSVSEHAMPDGRRLWRFDFGAEEEA